MGPPSADPQEEAKKESAAAEEVIRKAREKRALDAGRCDSDIPLEVRINGIRSMFWICSRSFNFNIVIFTMPDGAKHCENDRPPERKQSKR